MKTLICFLLLYFFLYPKSCSQYLEFTKSGFSYYLMDSITYANMPDGRQYLKKNLPLPIYPFIVWKEKLSPIDQPSERFKKAMYLLKKDRQKVADYFKVNSPVSQEDSLILAYYILSKSFREKREIDFIEKFLLGNHFLSKLLLADFKMVKNYNTWTFKHFQENYAEAEKWCYSWIEVICLQRRHFSFYYLNLK